MQGLGGSGEGAPGTRVGGNYYTLSNQTMLVGQAWAQLLGVLHFICFNVERGLPRL